MRVGSCGEDTRWPSHLRYVGVMKGIVFNLLEDVITTQHGAATWDDVLLAAGVEGAYTSLGNYADEELMAVVTAAARASQRSIPETIRWFGCEAIPRLAALYPGFFQGHVRTRDFMATLNDIIHPEVRKLYPGADVPWFEFQSPSPDRVVLGYRSPRKLCAFAEGLITGAAAHFGERAAIEQTECMIRGDARCVLICTFSEIR